MLRAQPLSAEQQADFIFSALEGEARREVAILDAAQRSTFMGKLSTRHKHEQPFSSVDKALMRRWGIVFSG